MSEAEVVRETLSRLTDSPFEISDGSRGVSLPPESVKWLVWCPDVAYIKNTAHVSTVWEGNDGNIWLESIDIGNTADWVEEDYGEQGRVESLKMSYDNFSKPANRLKFGKSFPLVLQRLAVYDEMMERISKKTRVHLEIKHDVGHGLVFFCLCAKVQAKDMNPKSRIVRVEEGVRTLKESYQEIREYETRVALEKT